MPSSERIDRGLRATCLRLLRKGTCRSAFGLGIHFSFGLQERQGRERLDDGMSDRGSRLYYWGSFCCAHGVEIGFEGVGVFGMRVSQEYLCFYCIWSI